MSVRDAVDLVTQFQAEPWEFVKQILCAEPTDQQFEALAAVAQPGGKVAIFL